VDATNDPRPTYLFNLLLGHHGVFSMTPVLIFAVWAIARAIIKRSPDRAEALTIGLPFCVMVSFYTITTTNYGGSCLGFRWLMPLTSILFTFVPLWLSQNRSRVAMILFVLSTLVGQYNAFTGLPSPWTPSVWDRLVRSLTDPVT
jgi:4-hydroxybenzoate polyprenyltransferase